jgi:hypothetical protein
MSKPTTLCKLAFLATVLLLVHVDVCSAAGGRQLLASPSSSPKPANSPSAKSPQPTVLPGLPYVHDEFPIKLYPELIPLVDEIQKDVDVMTQVLKCSETVGIPTLASEFSNTIYNAVYAFKAYGFCALPDIKGQLNRVEYMVDYGVSLATKAVLLQDFVCEGLEEMPEECFLSKPISKAIARAAATHYGGDTGRLCADTDSGEMKELELHTLPLTYKQEVAPKYKCTPRPPPTVLYGTSPSSPAPVAASPAPPAP